MIFLLAAPTDVTNVFKKKLKLERCFTLEVL